MSTDREWQDSICNDCGFFVPNFEALDKKPICRKFGVMVAEDYPACPDFVGYVWEGGE